jgi:hypothetical protein
MGTAQVHYRLKAQISVSPRFLLDVSLRSSVFDTD